MLRKIWKAIRRFFGYIEKPEPLPPTLPFGPILPLLPVSPSTLARKDWPLASRAIERAEHKRTRIRLRNLNWKRKGGYR